MKVMARIEVAHLYISDAHNYVGHHGKPPGRNPMLGMQELHCVAGKGVEGDRYFDYKENYKGQITFFEEEVYEMLRREFHLREIPPSAARRNVITRGIDLNTLIGNEFEIQGVEFEGVEECRPCYWMDQAFAPGAFERLKGHGGLRARILTDGTLRIGG